MVPKERGTGEPGKESPTRDLFVKSLHLTNRKTVIPLISDIICKS